MLVFGAGRPLNGVILQPSDLFQSTSEFLSAIQSTIDNANATLPRHSRLVPELIIVASHDKPFSTTDKATVKTKDTLDRYADEIKNAYTVLEEGREGEWSFSGTVTNPQDVKEFLRKTVQTLLGTNVPDTADLFEHGDECLTPANSFDADFPLSGLDSLLSIRLRTALLAVVKDAPTASQDIPRNITYTFPTIEALTDYLVSRASTDKPQLTNASHGRILRSIAKFSSSFVPHKPGSKVVNGSVVALTGSTGSLGEIVGYKCINVH